MKKIYYPAVFHKEDDSVWVEFPDLEGCFSQGENQMDAMEKASEAMGLYIASLLEEHKPIPKASEIFKVIAEPDSIVSLVGVDIEAHMKKHSKKAVKKTLTIPSWLNTMAEEKGINFSYVLQDALKNELNIGK